MNELYQFFLASTGISTDSRNVKEGCIYFALKGSSFDGNRFASEALQKGASFAVIDNPEYKSSEKMILVDDVLSALQKLANHHRKQLNTLVIGITGSNGKTTTKELINAVLSESFNVIATKGNLNNHIGVPLTLLSIKPETDIAIVEMGANHPGEIAFLCSLAEPDYGYITSIGKAHLEGFGSFEGVVKTKGELYDFLKKRNKTIVFNADDALQSQLLANYENKYAFGRGQDVNVLVECLKTSPVEVSFKETFGRTIVTSQLTGAYNFPNIAAAIAFGRFFKLSPTAIQCGIEKYVPNNNRSQIVEKEGNTILLDAYNANPSSMTAAIHNILTMNRFDKKILVIGDMFELGDYAHNEHQNIVNLIEQHTWEAVFLVGENFARTQSKYPQFKTFEDFKNKFKEQDFTDCLILIKGSRGMALERILDIFA